MVFRHFCISFALSTAPLAGAAIHSACTSQLTFQPIFKDPYLTPRLQEELWRIAEEQGLLEVLNKWAQHYATTEVRAFLDKEDFVQIGWLAIQDIFLYWDSRVHSELAQFATKRVHDEMKRAARRERKKTQLTEPLYAETGLRLRADREIWDKPFIDASDIEVLQNALKALDHSKRTLVEQLVVEGMPVKKAANRRKVAPSTISKRRDRVLEELRNEMGASIESLSQTVPKSSERDDPRVEQQIRK